MQRDQLPQRAALIVLACTTSVVMAQKDIKPPETFTANAQVVGKDAGSSAQVTIQIDQYTPDDVRNTIQEALRIGGFQGFLPALRSAPQVGYVEMAGRKVPVRWARQQAHRQGPHDFHRHRDPAVLRRWRGNRCQAAQGVRGGRHPARGRFDRPGQWHDGGGRSREAGWCDGCSD